MSNLVVALGLASCYINLPSIWNKLLRHSKSLTTLSFFENRVLPYINLEDIMAVDYWDASKIHIVYDKKKFDSQKGVWVRKADKLALSKPSPQEAYKKFRKSISVSEDPKTKLVTVSVEHKSPYVANLWASIMVDEINKKFRSDHKKEASIAIDYLNSLISQTNYSEVKKAIAQLIQLRNSK